MNFYEVEHRDGAVAVRANRWGRLADAAVRVALWWPTSFVGLVVLFTPDYVCHYREQEPVPGLFWVVMGVAAAAIAGVAGLVRFARRDRWRFDADSGEVVFQADPMVGTTEEAAVELSDWTKLEGRAVGTFRVSGVSIGIDGRPDEIVCTSRFGWDTVAEVFRALEALIEDRELEVDIRKRTT